MKGDINSRRQYMPRRNPVVGQSFVPQPPFLTGNPPKGQLIRNSDLPWGKYVLTLEPTQFQNGRPNFDYAQLNIDQSGVAHFGSVAAGAPRGILSWGSGGRRRQVQFDWPVCGGVFNVTGEDFELDIVLPSTGALVAGGQDLPVYSAAISPGESDQARPMTLAQRLAGNLGTNVAARIYPIPPMAYGVIITENAGAAAPRELLLLDNNNQAVCYNLKNHLVSVVGTIAFPPWDVILIPTQAQYLEAQGPAAGASDIFLHWVLGIE